MDKFFYIRVVLHNAKPEQYAKLAQTLLHHGITDVKEICGGNRKLPPGEYWTPDDGKVGTLQMVLYVRNIATKISPNPEVVVIHGVDIQGMF